MFCATAVAWQIQSPLGTQEDKVKVPGENPLTVSNSLDTLEAAEITIANTVLCQTYRLSSQR